LHAENIAFDKWPESWEREWDWGDDIVGVFLPVFGVAARKKGDDLGATELVGEIASS